MFETLTKGFRTAKQRFSGLAELDEATVNDALGDVRTSLLEADVGYDVVQDFCNRVREKAVGVIVKVRASTKEKVRRVSPEDHFVKICHDELVDLMGPVDTSLKYAKKGPTGIMLVGLQGSGKTTTVGKLARFLEKNHKRPLLVAADVYRPAAIEQLKVIGERLGLSEHTVKDHLMLAHRRLNVDSTIGAFTAVGWLRRPDVDHDNDPNLRDGMTLEEAAWRDGQP
jgi:signal recognition particle subunit SRP54